MLGRWAAQHGSGAEAEAGWSYVRVVDVRKLWHCSSYVGCKVVLIVFGATGCTPATTAAAVAAAPFF